MRLSQAVTSWVQAFAFDASNPQDDDGVDGDNRDNGGRFTSEGAGEGSEDDMAALQMECTVHEILLKNQVKINVDRWYSRSVSLPSFFSAIAPRAFGEQHGECGVLLVGLYQVHRGSCGRVGVMLCVPADQRSEGELEGVINVRCCLFIGRFL